MAKISYKMTDEELYAEYSRRYDIKAEYLRTKYGQEMEADKLDPVSFKFVFHQKRLENPKITYEVTVNRYINQQMSTMSQESLRAILRDPASIQLLRERGITNFTQESLRFDPKMRLVLNDLYRLKKEELVRQGLSPLAATQEAKKYVSRMVFNSD